MEYGEQGRVGLLDELRGLCVLLMVLYHGAYDLVHLFGWEIPLLHHPVMSLLQPFFAGVFIAISGVVSRFSRNNLRRGILVLVLGGVLSLITLRFMPEQAVRFGILHLLGLSMLVYAVVDTLLDRLSVGMGAGVFSLFFLLSYGLPQGYVGLPGAWGIQLPHSWYTLNLGYIVGLPSESFYSVDYFPLIPWVFLFLAGSYLGRWIKEGGAPRWIYPLRLPILATVGRHALMIYLVHQPVLYGLFWLLKPATP